MTLEEVVKTKKEHEEARERLCQTLSSSTFSGQEKHALLCQHRLTHGRQPFVCPRCWSYLPVCICSLMPTEKILLHRNLSLVVWIHHKEWGLTSNTGGLLGLILQDCDVLIKGLPEHDCQFNEIIQDLNSLVVVLWPDGNVRREGDDGGPNYMPIEELRDVLEQKRVVLVAVDGTWRTARRMVSKLAREKVVFTNLPVGVFQGLLENVKSGYKEGQIQSMLAPLRARGPSISEQQVCTAEAVLGALQQMGLGDDKSELIMTILKRRVDLVCRYRAKVPR